MAQAVTDVDKVHSLPSAKWRTRTANGIIWSESEGPRARSSDVQVQEKTDLPTLRQGKGRKRIHPSIEFFVLFRPPNGWVIFTLIDEGRSLYSEYGIKC